MVNAQPLRPFRLTTEKVQMDVRRVIDSCPRHAYTVAGFDSWASKGLHSNNVGSWC